MRRMLTIAAMFVLALPSWRRLRSLIHMGNLAA